MPETVSWNLQLTVQTGQLEQARSLMTEMVEATAKESGVMSYEWYLSDDGAACHTVEGYRDSDAALEHLGNFGAHFAERFMTCFAPTAFWVYGEPSAEVRGVLDGFGAVYLGSLGGFRR
jgi:quinol monooxygenase YgiN